MEAARFEVECRSPRTRGEQLDAELAGRIEELRQSREEAARLSERVESLKAQGEEQGNSIRLLEGQSDVVAAEAKIAAAEIARLQQREKR